MAKFSLIDADNCIVSAPDGSTFREASCVNPFIGKFYFPFEKYHINDGRYLYDFYPLGKYLETHYFLPFFAVALYAVALVLGTKFFENRKPWDLRMALAAWNLFLATYSFLTVLHALPFIPIYTQTPIRVLLCTNPISHFGGSSELWTILFVLSKFAELFDTFFIIVRKKPLILLHWYHHITVLLFCWVSFQDKTPSTFFFGPMNACVHSIMYFYYFLQSINCKPKWFNPIWLTIFQIVQMIVGTTLSILSVYYHMTDDNCTLKKPTLISSFLMYFSYLYLFFTFFLRRYFAKKSDVKKKTS